MVQSPLQRSDASWWTVPYHSYSTRLDIPSSLQHSKDARPKRKITRLYHQLRTRDKRSQRVLTFNSNAAWMMTLSCYLRFIRPPPAPPVPRADIHLNKNEKHMKTPTKPAKKTKRFSAVQHSISSRSILNTSYPNS